MMNVGGLNKVICKNDRCPELVPEGKNSGRPKEFCNERCRRRYNARLYYKRATSGVPFAGLKGVTSMGYPVITRRKPLTAREAEKRVKVHGENCAKKGEWCQAKLHDAYNTKKLCLVRAVFTDDWLELMYEEEGRERKRDMTTEDGMWIDDYNEMMRKSGLSEPIQIDDSSSPLAMPERGKVIPEFPST